MIRCENLSITFRRARVLDGINLDIALGERIVLIGSNGTGGPDRRYVSLIGDLSLHEVVK